MRLKTSMSLNFLCSVFDRVGGQLSNRLLQRSECICWWLNLYAALISKNLKFRVVREVVLQLSAPGKDWQLLRLLWRIKNDVDMSIRRRIINVWSPATVYLSSARPVFNRTVVKVIQQVQLLYAAQWICSARIIAPGLYTLWMLLPNPHWILPRDRKQVKVCERTGFLL